MRLFVALDIEDVIQQKLDDYVRTLQPLLPGVRFVRSDNYHVTLKFLGAVQNVDAVRERLLDVRAPAFELTFGGLGFFPDAHAPRVFWAGVNAAALPPLARSIDRSLEALGFRTEPHFHPHLTLARNGSGRPRPRHNERAPSAFAQLPAIVASSPSPEFGTITARQFFLYESRSSSVGPSYYKLDAFDLLP